MADLIEAQIADLRAWLSFPVGDDPPFETIYALLAERETLREALIRCAEIAGADGEAVAAARSGALKHSSVAEFAIRAVEQLRQDYDDDLREATP